MNSGSGANIIPISNLINYYGWEYKKNFDILMNKYNFCNEALF